MSTKTTFKRISLVTVAALGLGVLTSVAPASATITSTATLPFAVSVADAGTTEVPATSMAISQVAGANSYVTLKTGSTGSTAAGSGVYEITTSGAGSTIDSSTGYVLNAAKTTATFVTAALDNNKTVKVFTPTVGSASITVSVVTDNGTGSYTTTLLQTIAVSVTATSTGTAVASTTSTLNYFGADVHNSFGSDQAVVLDSALTSTKRAVVKVAVTNSLGQGFAKAISAQVDGPGFIKWAATAQVANADSTTAGSDATTLRYETVTTTSGGIAYLSVKSDGTAGTSSIKIYAGSTLLSTETVIFTGAATKLEVKAVEPHLVASAGATAGAFEIVARDANNNIATLPSLTATSSNPLVVTATLGTPVLITAAADGTVGGYLVPVTPGSTAGKASLTINPGSTSTNSPTVDFTVSGDSIKTLTLTTDKKTYAAGEKITLTLTAKDSSGVLIGKKEFAALLSDTSTVTTNGVTGTGLAKAAITFSKGVATATYYAPLASGKFSFKAVLGTSGSLNADLRGTTLTADASVSGGDVAGLTTLVNSLLKKINDLSKLVAKIQKKLGVK